MEGDGALVSSAGGMAGQAAVIVSSLRVDDSGPMDALRKAQQAAESVAGAAQDWGSWFFWVASADKRGRVGTTRDSVARKPLHPAATEACSARVIPYVPLAAPCSLPRMRAQPYGTALGCGVIPRDMTTSLGQAVGYGIDCISFSACTHYPIAPGREVSPVVVPGAHAMPPALSACLRNCHTLTVVVAGESS